MTKEEMIAGLQSEVAALREEYNALSTTPVEYEQFLCEGCKQINQNILNNVTAQVESRKKVLYDAFTSKEETINNLLTIQ